MAQQLSIDPGNQCENKDMELHLTKKFITVKEINKIKRQPTMGKDMDGPTGCYAK